MQEAVKQTYVHIKQPVKSDLTPLIGENIGAELTGLNQEQTGAIVASVMEKRSFWDLPGKFSPLRMRSFCAVFKLSHMGKRFSKSIFYPPYACYSIVLFTAYVKKVLDICRK